VVIKLFLPLTMSPDRKYHLTGTTGCR